MLRSDIRIVVVQKERLAFRFRIQVWDPWDVVPMGGHVQARLIAAMLRIQLARQSWVVGVAYRALRVKVLAVSHICIR